MAEFSHTLSIFQHQHLWFHNSNNCDGDTEPRTAVKNIEDKLNVINIISIA